MASPWVESIMQGLGAEAPTETEEAPEQGGTVKDPILGAEGLEGGTPIQRCRQECRERRRACIRRCRQTRAGPGCVENCREDLRDCREECKDGDGDGDGGKGECFNTGPERPNYKDCQCGVAFAARGPGDCPENYTWVPRGGRGWELYEEGMRGRCECSRWLAAMKAKAGGEEGGEGLGEFTMPPEMMRLYQALIGRGGEFMGRRPGFSDAVLRGIFGRDFEKVRGVGGREREQMYDLMAREGLLGTGAVQDIAGERAWATERNIGNIMRDLAISQEEKIKQDLLDYTRAGQDVFGQGMGFWQLIEAINAGRRGESAMAMNQLLSLLLGSYGTWT